MNSEEFPTRPPEVSTRPKQDKTIEITLTAGELSELTHGVPFDYKIVTVKRDYRGKWVDYPLPTVVSPRVGQKLYQADPKEAWWKVFIFPSHAEVWPAIQWQNSETRRLLGKEHQDNSQHLSSTDAILYVKILEIQKARGMPIDKKYMKDWAMLLCRTQNREIFKAAGLEEIYDLWDKTRKVTPHNQPEWYK